MLKLQPENTIVDIPDLNQFRIGDTVVATADGDTDQYEGIVIGIELQHLHGSNKLNPSITLLHDGCITDGFLPVNVRKVASRCDTHPSPEPNVPPALPKLPPDTQSVFAHGSHGLWTKKQMQQYARETAAYWRSDIVEKAAQIAERYGVDPWIARDIRALKA